MLGDFFFIIALPTYSLESYVHCSLTSQPKKCRSSIDVSPDLKTPTSWQQKVKHRKKVIVIKFKMATSLCLCYPVSISHFCWTIGIEVVRQGL